MTFLEAAIELLYQTGGPLHFKDLTERAIRKNLLSHVGKSPEQAMQTSLAQEAKKGGLLVRTKPGVFGLKSYERPKAGATMQSGEGEKRRRRRRRGGRGRGGAAAASPSPEPTPATVEEGTPEEGTPEEAIAAEELAAEAEAEPV